MSTIITLSMSNHPGALADLLEALAAKEVNVDGIEAEALGDYGMVRLSVEPAAPAVDVARSKGHLAAEVEALEVDLPNRPGELARMLRTLADAGVNVVSLFGTAHERAEGGRLLLRVNDRKKALRALGIE